MYPFSQKIIEFTWKQRNRTSADFLRLPRKPEIDQDRRRLLATQFRLDSGVRVRPSRPYLVSIDETGAFVETVEYGHEDHPLSRLADTHEPRDVEREAVFFFIVPKVIIMFNGKQYFMYLFSAARSFNAVYCIVHENYKYQTNGGKIKTIMTHCYDLRRAEKREDPEVSDYII